MCEYYSSFTQFIIVSINKILLKLKFHKNSKITTQNLQDKIKCYFKGFTQMC